MFDCSMLCRVAPALRSHPGQMWRLTVNTRRRCHRVILTDLPDWPARCAAIQNPCVGRIRVWSASSGTCMAEHCGHALAQAAGSFRYDPVCWIERDPQAAALLAEILPGATGDICALLPDHLTHLPHSELPPFDDLKRILVHEGPGLRLNKLRGSHTMHCANVLGDVHMAGLPCADSFDVWPAITNRRTYHVGFSHIDPIAYHGTAFRGNLRRRENCSVGSPSHPLGTLVCPG